MITTPLEELEFALNELTKQDERFAKLINRLVSFSGSAQCPPGLGITLRRIAYNQLSHIRVRLNEQQDEIRVLIRKVTGQPLTDRIY
jgi:hypothetical protein